MRMIIHGILTTRQNNKERVGFPCYTGQFEKAHKGHSAALNNYFVRWLEHEFVTLSRLASFCSRFLGALAGSIECRSKRGARVIGFIGNGLRRGCLS